MFTGGARRKLQARDSEVPSSCVSGPTALPVPKPAVKSGRWEVRFNAGRRRGGEATGPGPQRTVTVGATRAPGLKSGCRRAWLPPSWRCRQVGSLSKTRSRGPFAKREILPSMIPGAFRSRVVAHLLLATMDKSAAATSAEKPSAVLTAALTETEIDYDYTRES